ncbi:hypothetical protein [Zhihengliuella flava]|uniref:Sterol desaturase/sphingolipid hydroxylase (Fatty acid hydroxylase superfamily) n=1 Tax=Zhihengliuella flava TaxID=1285193 RepID=A0A931DCJ3_9MICC|nr:hypothetical protein [Zhihengliuella flava]MBG6084270.1 sterol desaturase/sphingolipid hydroxylase (fatty acid hydroxylase superfamily) [Zhihengliuella flava]
MLASLMDLPPVPLKTFAKRLWWALAASIGGSLLIGLLSFGSLVILTAFFSAGFFVAFLLLILLLRPALLRHAETLESSRKWRMLTVFFTAVGAYALGFAVWLLQFTAGAFLTGAPVQFPDGPTWALVAYAMTLPAAVAVLTAWLLEIFGARRPAERPEK